MTDQGYSKITATKVYQLVSQVDFCKIRKKILKDYKQEKYNKNTRWVFAKYQQVIDQLLKKLETKQTLCPKDKQKLIDDLPATVPTDKLQVNLPEEPYSTTAWLKCFLFNLPTSLDGKICCPTCGSFETAKKSKIPLPQIANDPKTGKTITVNTFRFYCKNPHCSVNSFSSTADGSHVLGEARYAKFATMLRLVFNLNGSYRATANLLGTQKSSVFDSLTLISKTIYSWEDILGISRFSGTLCVDEKFVKIAQFKKSKGNRPFAYLFFAVDADTSDLLHIDIYPTRDAATVTAFLNSVKAQGIYPNVIMTDHFAGYDSAIGEVYGRVVTITKCHFHFCQNINKHIYKQFNKKNVPQLAKQLKNDIFFIVGAKSKKTISKWHEELKKLKPEYLRREPKLLPVFTCLESYLPYLLKAIEHPNVSHLTNNPCEQVIRHFNQRYKLTAGFNSLDTALRHARLFQIVYRFTPFSPDAKKSIAGRAPLELAGYKIDHMPIYQYLTQPLLFNLQPAQNLALCKSQVA